VTELNNSILEDLAMPKKHKQRDEYKSHILPMLLQQLIPIVPFANFYNGRGTN
jgi:hypothetical protein